MLTMIRHDSVMETHTDAAEDDDEVTMMYTTTPISRPLTRVHKDQADAPMALFKVKSTHITAFSCIFFIVTGADAMDA